MHNEIAFNARDKGARSNLDISSITFDYKVHQYFLVLKTLNESSWGQPTFATSICRPIHLNCIF